MRDATARPALSGQEAGAAIPPGQTGFLRLFSAIQFAWNEVIRLGWTEKTVSLYGFEMRLMAFEASPISHPSTTPVILPETMKNSWLVGEVKSQLQ